MQVLINGPDVTLLIWPTCEKEFEAKPEIRFRIDNKLVVEPGTKIKVHNRDLKDKCYAVYYTVEKVIEVRESVTTPNQNIITARVNRLVE